jgi:hypothetical protein
VESYDWQTYRLKKVNQSLRTFARPTDESFVCIIIHDHDCQMGTQPDRTQFKQLLKVGVKRRARLMFCV